MTDLTLESLAERVDRLESHNRRLERQNRRLKAAGVVAVAVFAAVVCMGQAGVPEVMEARKFVLRDDAGTERAVLAAQGDETTLTLHDAQGKQRARVAAHEIRGGTLRLKGNDSAGGEARLGDSGLEFTSAPGGGYATLSPSGLSISHYLVGEVAITNDSLELYEMAGGRISRERRRRMRLALSQERAAEAAPKVTPNLALYDAQARPRLNLTLGEDGSPALHLSDAEGQSLFSAP